jgi:hypothetical protein
MRDVVRRMVEKVTEQTGERHPPAALQALNWYPEQELYKSLGVRLRVTSQDYAGAAKGLLLKEGFNEQHIRTATEPGSGRARPVAGSADGREHGQAGQWDSKPGALQGVDRSDFLARHAGGLQQIQFSPKRDAIHQVLRLGQPYRNGSGDRKNSRIHVNGKLAQTIDSFSLGEKQSEDLRKVGISTPVMHELPGSSAEIFQRAIKELREGNVAAASVNVYSADEYRGMRLFLADGGKTGFALKGDDIVSVFNHDSNTRGSA